MPTWYLPELAWPLFLAFFAAFLLPLLVGLGLVVHALLRPHHVLPVDARQRLVAQTLFRIGALVALCLVGLFLLYLPIYGNIIYKAACVLTMVVSVLATVVSVAWSVVSLYAADAPHASPADGGLLLFPVAKSH